MNTPQLLLGCLVILTCSSLAAAQQPDIRVSPDDPLSYDLPADIRIQSAAAIGSRTLAVWGTTVDDPDSGVVNALVMQMIEDTTLFGQQRRLTSNEARPYGFVQVVDLASSFLVIWNDRRSDAPGIYARQVDTDGVVLRNEERISQGIVQPDSTGRITITGDPAVRRMLIWQDRRVESSGVYTMPVDAAGNIQAEHRLGNGTRRVLKYSNLPDSFLLILGDSTVYFLDPSYDYPRSISRSLMSRRFYLGSDTSLVCLSGSTVFYFASIFDSVPAWTTAIPALDSALNGTGLITRDSTGLIHVYFNTIHVSGDEYKAGLQIIHAYDVQIFSEDSISGPTLVKHYAQANGGCTQTYNPFLCSVLKFAKVTQELACDNGDYVYINWLVRSYLRGQPTSLDPYTSYSVGFVDNLGRYQLILFPLASPPPCSIQGPLSIFRASDSTRSAVTAHIGKVPVLLYADIPPSPSNLPQNTPAIFLGNNELSATWVQPDNRPLKLGQWQPFSAQPTNVIASHGFPKITTNYGGDAIIKSSYKSGWGQQLHLPAGPVIANYERLQEEVLFHYTDLYSETIVIDATDFQIVRATPNGWQSWLSIADKAPYFPSPGTTAAWHSGVLCGYDPNRDEVLAAVAYFAQGTSPSISLYWCGSKGVTHTSPNISTLDWGYQINRDPVIYLPVVPSEYLRINGDSVVWKRDQTTIAEYTFATSGSGAHYQRLLGPYFLRSFWNDAAGADLTFELYTIGGELVATGSTQLLSRSGDMMIVQNPADSSLTVVYADDTGVHATYFDKRLNRLGTNVAVGATREPVVHPAAVWRNDTLFAVWEDYRNGNADIYGNWIRRTDMLSSVPAVEQTAQEFTLQPNPAHGRLRVMLPSSAGAELEIIDMLGAVVQSAVVERGRSAVDLDLGSLSAGVYLVRCRIAEGLPLLRRFVVAH